MNEKQTAFNPNPEKDALDILKLGIFKLCNVYPEEYEKSFKLVAVGEKDSRRLHRQLKSLPNITNTLKISRDPLHPRNVIFRIDKATYLENFSPSKLQSNFGLNDSHDTNFNHPGHWDRINDLNDITKRQWGQQHSPVYESEVIQMVPSSNEPASREEQVTEMSRLLIGESKRSIAETRDWISHIAEREIFSPHTRDDIRRTALPSSWVTKANVTELYNRVRLSKEERDRLRSTLSLG